MKWFVADIEAQDRCLACEVIPEHRVLGIHIVSDDEQVFEWEGRDENGPRLESAARFEVFDDLTAALEFVKRQRVTVEVDEEKQHERNDRS
jgi:hypothetical protein